MFLSTGSAVHFGEHTISAVSEMAAPHAGTVWWRHIVGAFALLSLGGLTRSGRKLAHTERLLEDQTRLCRELSAYLTLDLCPEQMPRREFARLLCRTVATRSSFARAALMLREPTGALSVVGSAGVDDVTVNSLNRWGSAVGAEANGGRFLLHLERRSAPGRQGIGAMNCANVHVIPMRSAKGPLGALVVSAEPRPSVQGALTPVRLQRMMEPMEALCARLSQQFARLAEVAVLEPRRREHTARSHGDHSGQRRAARRRGVERAGGTSFTKPEQTTADQVAAMAAAAARSGKALLQLPGGAAPAGLPPAHRSIPHFGGSHGASPGPRTA